MTTLREAAEIALAALDHPNFQGAEDAEIILRSALEQQAKQDETYDSLERFTQEIRTILKNATNRQWQGLTDSEIEQGQKESWVDKQAFESVVWWAEKKLKEKNA